MYARVAVASNAVATVDLPAPVANLIHRNLLDQINAHARLVFRDDPEVTDLLRAIKSSEAISPDARKLWFETLTRLKKLGRIRVLHDHGPLSDVTDILELRASWGACADIAVVAVAACEALGVPMDVGMLSSPGTLPDVAITSAAQNSPAMQRLKALVDVGIASPGSAREEFWEQVLEPLATDARSVTILDAYLFKPTWDLEERKPWTRPWAGEHLAWLLEHLDGVMASEAEVILLGNTDRDNRHVSADDTASAIRKRWGPTKVGRLKKVRVSLAAPVRGDRFPHDRHIRFSSGGAIEISAGLDRLRDGRIWDPDGMKWKYIWNATTLQALQAAETRAQSYATHSEALVLDR